MDEKSGEEQTISITIEVLDRNYKFSFATTNTALLATCSRAGIFVGLFLNPEDGVDMFLETSVDFERTTRRYILKDIAQSL
jgi:hypothetical protein